MPVTHGLRPVAEPASGAAQPAAADVSRTVARATAAARIDVARLER